MTKFTTVMPGMPGDIGTYYNSLIGEDDAGFSSREKSAVDKGMAHGELYWAQVERTENALIVSTDLGDPGSFVELKLPLYLTNRIAILALCAAVEVTQLVE